MMTKPCPHCRRLSHQVGLTLAMMGLTLALCALMMGCASPCRPTVDLARWAQINRMDGTVEEIWVRCETRF